MKCPHCNKEHEEGMKYCPYTGEEIIPTKSCPNPQCVNYGKNILPNDYLFCPYCKTQLEVEHSTDKNTVLSECKYDVVLVSADKRIISEIERRLGLSIIHNGIKNRLFPDRMSESDFNSVFPYTIKGKVAEAMALKMKKELELLGARVELQRLNSSTVADFRKGNIYVNNVVLGKTRLQEMLSSQYNEYDDELEDRMHEEIVGLSFDLSEGVTALIQFVNPELGRETISRLRAEYEGMFITSSKANYSFAENNLQIVNCLETTFEAMPCFSEMGIDDDIFYLNEENGDRPAEDIENRISDIITSYGWVKIDNFLRAGNLFEADDVLKATFRCTLPSDTGNTVYMLLFVSSKRYFGGWDSCRIIFAINLEK